MTFLARLRLFAVSALLALYVMSWIQTWRAFP